MPYKGPMSAPGIPGKKAGKKKKKRKYTRLTEPPKGGYV